MTRRTKDETGAYVIMFAMLVTTLMVIAAFAVDIGNAVARKSDVQGQADFGALAAAQELGSATSGTIPAAAVNAARDYINNNSPVNQDCAPGCVTSAQLTDCPAVPTSPFACYDNGEVLWAQNYVGTEFCGPVGLCVITPKEHVDYGLAKVIGINGRDVQASATVGIFSPGRGPLPMYAVSGCDYGTQTIKDDSGQPNSNEATNLALSTDTNDADLSSITTPTPPQISVVNPAGPGPALTVVGSNFIRDNGNDRDQYAVTKIGFFLNDGSTYHAVNVSAASTAGLARIDNVPTAVASTEGDWWVRVYVEGTNDPTDIVPKWSPMNEALLFRVGVPELECDSESSDGNFGTLTLPRQDINSPSDDLPVNIADTLDDPLSLAIDPTVADDGECTEPDFDDVTSGDPNPGLNPDTNCVDTLTGLRSNDATAGFITGVNANPRGNIPGRLAAAQHPTNPDCGRSDYSIALGNQSYSINNDTLSCFLTDTGSLASIMSSSYNGSSRLSDEIYSSPRFFWLPVLSVEAASGGSGRYSIIDFRPGFITNETSAATKAASDASGDNGFIVQNNLIRQVKVIFFDEDALPSTTDGPISDYLGFGPRILRLID